MAWPVRTAGIEGSEETGLSTLVSQLVDDARDVARAEIGVYKAKAAERAQAYKGAVVFFVVAAVLVLEALGALLLGIIMTLATLLGPGWSTLIVVGVVLAIAVVLAMFGKGRLAPPPGVVS